MNKQRKLIFEKTGGKCLYCGVDLTNTKWQADHFHPIIRHPEKGICLYPKLDTIDNLFPSCAPCNNFKSSLSIEGYRYRVLEQQRIVLNESSGLRQLQRLGLVVFPQGDTFKFWFEQSGIEVPDRYTLMGINLSRYSKIIWHRDEADRCDYLRLPDSILTVRQVNDYYLVMNTDYDWYKKSTRLEMGNKKDVLLQAIAWAEAEGINLGL